MQSALGRVLLRKLPQMVEKRRHLATILTERFSQMPGLRVTVPPAEIRHSYYKYYVFLRPERLRENWTRQRIIDAINAEGIPCFSGSCSEIYMEKAFPAPMRPQHRLAIAKQLGETALMFLVHPTLSESDMHDTADAVGKVLTAASI
jgi:dTDP-4-amino-4,6-dideoxygalactose transaminase